MTALNPNAQAWVEALESGEYKQGRGALRIGDEFCCLGVACDLAVKAGVPVVVEELPHRVANVAMYDGTATWLPPSVQTWLGLAVDIGEFFLADGEPTSLTDLNDEQGKSFAEIAETIRTHPELFARTSHHGPRVAA